MFELKSHEEAEIKDDTDDYYCVLHKQDCTQDEYCIDGNIMFFS